MADKEKKDKGKVKVECPCRKELNDLVRAHQAFFKALVGSSRNRVQIGSILHNVHMTLGYLEMEDLSKMELEYQREQANGKK